MDTEHITIIKCSQCSEKFDLTGTTKGSGTKSGTGTLANAPYVCSKCGTKNQEKPKQI